MATILNKIAPNSTKVKIRVIKDGFSSPILGNAYIGQVKTLNYSTAERFVKGGYAEFVTDEQDDAKDDNKKGGGQGEGAAPLQDQGGEGAAAGSAELSAEGAVDDTPAAAEKALEDAIMSLNPDEDSHWTKRDGLPDLNALKEKTGRVITREAVESIAAGYTRDTARDVANAQ